MKWDPTADELLDSSIDGFRIPTDSSEFDAEKLHDCSRRVQTMMMGMTIKETSSDSLKISRRRAKQCESPHTISDSQLNPVIGKRSNLAHKYEEEKQTELEKPASEGAPKSHPLGIKTAKAKMKKKILPQTTSIHEQGENDSNPTLDLNDIYEGGEKTIGCAHGLCCSHNTTAERYAVTGNRNSLSQMTEIGHSLFRNRQDGFPAIEIPGVYKTTYVAHNSVKKPTLEF